MRVCAPKTAYLLLIIVLICYLPCFAGWSVPAFISQRTGGYYPQVTAQGDTLHVVYESDIPYDKICYIRSSDAGETWSQNVRVSEHNGATAYPRIIRWNNRLMALWRTSFDDPGSRLNIGFATSNDDGLTWSQPQRVFDRNWSYINTYTVSSEDSLINIVLYSDQGPDNICYGVRSTNFGASWSVAQQIFIAVESGLPDQACVNEISYYAWDGRIDSSLIWEIRFITSSDGGINWSQNALLSDSDEHYSEYPALAADSTNVVCTWMDYKYSPYLTGDIFLRRSTDYGINWSAEQQITFHHRASISDVLMTGDTIIIAWQDHRPENGQGGIYSVRSIDGGETWSEPDWVDNDYGPSYDPALATGNGRAYLIWYDWIYPDSAGIYYSRFDTEPYEIRDDESANQPNEMALSAYPNPFNSSTTLSIGNAKAADISIYDITGRKMAALSAKEGKAIWNASAYSSGIYFAKAAGKNNSSIVKLIYLK